MKKKLFMLVVFSSMNVFASPVVTEDIIDLENSIDSLVDMVGNKFPLAMSHEAAVCFRLGQAGAIANHISMSTPSAQWGYEVPDLTFKISNAIGAAASFCGLDTEDRAGRKRFDKVVLKTDLAKVKELLKALNQKMPNQ